MKHIRSATCEKPAMAQEEQVCGFLFTRDFTKCVDADSPLAPLLKTVPIP
jgi:hypothetical protein